MCAIFKIVSIFGLLAVVQCYVRVCYYTNWSQYRNGRGKFKTPDDIIPSLCTHIIYAFAMINDLQLDTYEWNDETMYEKVIELKEINPALKVLLAVGGWNHENGFSSKFSTMVSSKENRIRFIDNAISYLRRYNFDGLDLDWEYPTARDNSPLEDKFRFTDLCKEMREMFQDDADLSNQPRLLLTAAVTANPSNIQQYYEVDKLGDYLDMLNLMSYDLHGYWDGTIGHHTTLDPTDSVAVTKGLREWIDNGFPASKIALGLAAYGRTFRSSGSQIGSISNMAGAAGPFTNEEGFLSYYEVCQKITNAFVVVEGDDNAAKAPYGYNSQQSFWVGYENEASITYKVRHLIKANQLMGAMIWSLDLDDFSGSFCEQGKYPLLTAINNELDIVAPSTTPSSTITKVASTTSNTIATTTTPVTTKTKTTITTMTTQSTNCYAVPPYNSNSNMNNWCVTNCAVNYCPASHCKCGLATTTTTTGSISTSSSSTTKTPVITTGVTSTGSMTPSTTTTTTTTGAKSTSTSSTTSNPVITTRVTATSSMTPSATTTTTTTDSTSTSTSSTANTPVITTGVTSTTTTTPVTTRATTSSSQCYAIPPYDATPGMDNWCVINCAGNHCPPTHCKCG